MPKLWKKTGNAKNPSDLVEVDLASLVVSSPTVIFFPGQFASDDNAHFTSIELNEIKKVFNDQPQPPDVYIWSHPDDGTKKISFARSIFRSAFYNATACRSSIYEANKLAKGLIIPLVTDAEGRRLPLAEAQKNIRNLTFLGFCVGSIAAQEVYNSARKMIKKAGYSRKETRQILQDIVFISFATMSEPKKEDNRYTSISFLYNDDLPIRGKDWVISPLQSTLSMSKRFFKSSQKLKIEQLSDSSLLVSANAMGRKKDLKKAHQEVIEGVQLPPWDKKTVNHFIPDYINANDNSSQFSRIVQHALINAVNRKDTVKPMDLLAAPATLDAETKALYQRKIQQALRA